MVREAHICRVESEKQKSIFSSVSVGYLTSPLKSKILLRFCAKRERDSLYDTFGNLIC